MRKTFIEYLNENVTYFKVGDHVDFSLQAVSAYNQDMVLTMDYGVIVDTKGENYIVRLSSGQEIMVKNQDLLSHGTDGIDPAIIIP